VNHICVIGLQWGDEGKGKVVDVLSHDVNAVVRFQGGGNAGHTVYVDGQKFVLHHIPTGVLHNDVLAILGNGMVIEPKEFLQEYNTLTDDQKSRVRISDRAHLVLQRHLTRDAERENGGKVTKIGTTLRGIGPTYEDKYARFGTRVGDLHREKFWDVLEPTDRNKLQPFYEAIKDKIVDTVSLIHKLDKCGHKILFEGAQGVLLDVDFGQYPFVTSSSCTSLGVGVGSGFSPRKIRRIIGVAKVYPTRVGTGPFPSKASPEDDEWLRQTGKEFGATTGRPRKCGWLDIPALKYAIQVGDVDEIALTKLDILSGRKEIPVCTAYKYKGDLLNDYPSDTQILNEVEPVFEMWPGWQDARRAEDWQPFVERLEGEVDRQVVLVGCGPDRSDILATGNFVI
jgi:adenylosuccinate synthase